MQRRMGKDLEVAGGGDGSRCVEGVDGVGQLGQSSSRVFLVVVPGYSLTRCQGCQHQEQCDLYHIK